MGPFSDIAFLLIIFFILTTSLIRPMGRFISMPSSTSQSEQDKAHNPTVTILPDKILYGEKGKGDEELGLLELRARLLAMGLKSRREEQRTIVVDLADNVPYETFYRVATAISKADGVIALLEEAERTDAE